MKTQISKASHGLAKYSEEYRQQALELWRKSGRSANKVAAELGIRPSLLYKWSTDARQTQPGGTRSVDQSFARRERQATRTA